MVARAAPAAAAPRAGAIASPGRRFRVLRGMARDPMTLAALLVVVVVSVAALTGPLISPYDPIDQQLSARLRPPFWAERGSLAHPLGTDNLGRDLLSRMIYGARVSATIGLVVVGITAIIGTAIGLTAGYFGGRLDNALIGITDVVLSFPGLLLALTIVALFSPNLYTVILALSLRGWVVYARVARGQALSLSKYQFIEAARSIGAPAPLVMGRHLLPNLLPSIVTIAVLELARMVLAESSLSFIGLGVQPPTISWGLMLAEGRNYMLTANWLVTLPGVAIAVTVVSVNILASYARRVMDPYQRGRIEMERH